MKFALGLILMFFLTDTRGYAQSANIDVSSRLDSLTKLSQRLTNDGQSDSLYNLMGDAFKKEISPEKMKEVVSEINIQLGKWTGLELQSVKDGVAHYKATFTLAVLNLFISSDKYGKIETFLFKP